MSRFAVIAEDRSDTDTLKVLVRRIAKDETIPIMTKGYDGAGDLLKKGAAQLRSYYTQFRCNRFIVCYDADDGDPGKRKLATLTRVVRPAGIPLGRSCVVIPVQEIEAWLLADLRAVQNIITGWNTPPDLPSPETIPSPKEHLRKLSRDLRRRPRYNPSTDNRLLAKHVDLAVVRHKCPSFRPLCALVEEGRGNCS